MFDNSGLGGLGGLLGGLGGYGVQGGVDSSGQSPAEQAATAQTDASTDRLALRNAALAAKKNEQTFEVNRLGAKTDFVTGMTKIMDKIHF